MGRDDSRIARVLGELADLGKRIGERAEELALLAGRGRDANEPVAARETVEVAASAAQLAASAAGLAGRKPGSADRDPARDRPAGSAERAAARQTPKKPGSPAGSVDAKRSRGKPPAACGRRAVKRPALRAATTWWRVKPAGPVFVSTVMHLVVLVGLAMIFVARDAKTDPFVITSDRPAETFVEEFTPLEFEAAEESAEESLEPSPAELVSFDAEPVALDEIDVAADSAPGEAADIMPVSFEASDMLATIGGGAGGEAGGGGRGSASGGGAAGAPTFFGKPGAGKSVCFVCDNSNSYRDGGFHTVLAEVARAVDALQPEQSFFVIFFSDAAYPMWHPDRLDALQPATPENKARLRAWLGTVEMCSGGQGIHDAVKLAAGLDADVVYFLSDGDHGESVVDRVVKADFGETAMHTFGMQQSVFDKRTGATDPERVREQQACNQTLIEIATAHGGTFTPVIVPPQAAALEQLRPIRKNRSRGPIWGLKL